MYWFVEKEGMLKGRTGKKIEKREKWGVGHMHLVWERVEGKGFGR